MGTSDGIPCVSFDLLVDMMFCRYDVCYDLRVVGTPFFYSFQRYVVLLSLGNAGSYFTSRVYAFAYRLVIFSFTRSFACRLGLSLRP